MSATSIGNALGRGAANFAKVEPDWAIITEFSVRPVHRGITVFLPNKDGSWRRDSERHENVLVDASGIPALLAQHGINANLSSSFGDETLPVGLLAVTGLRRA